MVMVDKFSKATLFIPVKSTHKAKNIARIFMEELFKLHELLKAIVLDCDVKFTSKFWKGLFQDLGTQLNFNIAYHPQIDGQTKRVNKVLEDMLIMYVMEKMTKWEDHLHLVEFSFNNGQQATLHMSLFEALYGKNCRTLVNWDSPINIVIVGPTMLT